jgi:muramoyltetrapeptide carboxypeptidase
MREVRFPKRLRAGDRVALVAAAGPVDAVRVAGAVALLEGAGLQVSVRQDIASRQGYLAGPDARRLEELREALVDPAVSAVFLARGGYGTQRILPDLALPPGLPPKPVVGFSDNTALLSCFQNALGWAVLHGPHPGPGHERAEEYREVLACLGLGETVRPLFKNLRVLRGGEGVEAPVSGGCLAVLSSSVGTGWAPDFRGRIAFFEDIGEPVYRLDRYLNHLLRAGALDGAVGVVFGRPAAFVPEGVDPADVDALLEEFASRLDIPVLSGLPCGHVEGHRPLPFGPRARLDPAEGTLAFLEDFTR